MAACRVGGHFHALRTDASRKCLWVSICPKRIQQTARSETSATSSVLSSDTISDCSLADRPFTADHSFTAEYAESAEGLFFHLCALCALCGESVLLPIETQMPPPRWGGVTAGWALVCGSTAHSEAQAEDGAWCHGPRSTVCGQNTRDEQPNWVSARARAGAAEASLGG